MALYYDLPVFKDVYQMTLRIFQVTTLITFGTALYQKIIIALYYDMPVFKDVTQMTLRIFQVTTYFTGDA